MWTMFRRNSIVSLIAVQLCIHITIISGLKHENFPRKCQQFLDRRISPRDADELSIPPHLNHGSSGHLRFRLTSADHGSATELFEKHCNNVDEIHVSLLEGSSIKRNKYPFQDQSMFENNVYFTNDGYIHSKSHFIHPNDYCVSSLTDQEINIKTCKVDCSGDLRKTYLYSADARNRPSVSRICIPKCCGIDEILNITDSTCRRLNDSEPNYFFPYLHLARPSNVHEVDKHNLLVTPMLGKRPYWNLTDDLITPDFSIWENLHFNRNSMNCSKYKERSVYFNDVKQVNTEISKTYNFRVEVHPGNVRLQFLTRSRKWVPYRHKFCVDGADKFMNENKNPVSQMVVMCVPDSSSDEYKTTDEIRIEGEEGKIIWSGDYFYLATLLLCTLVLLLGSGFYLALAKHFNVFGFIVLSHLGCLTFSYGATFLASVISMSEHSRVGSNAVIIINPDIDGKRIGWFCVGIGVVCHYLYVSTFLWLSALNSEAWLSLQNLGYKYWVYGINCWLLPVIFILGLCIADGLNSDPWSNAVVPDYGVETCHVSSWTAGYFVYAPGGIILACNVIFILVKVYKLYSPSCFRQTLAETEITNGSAAVGIPFKLYAIVCSVEAFVWLITITEWVRVNNEQDHNWARTVLLILAALTQTLVLFHLYCMNGTIVDLIAEKYPFVKGMFDKFKKWGVLWDNGGMIADFVITEDNPNDTVVIENHDIPRA